MPLIPCRYCHERFPDFHALAIHIRDSKTGHRFGKRWAASYLLKAQLLSSKKDISRSPMTDEQREAVREAKEDTRRDLSGEIRNVKTYCPNCKNTGNQVLPVEYAESNQAWRLPSGILVVCCPNCTRR